jgi:DNA polymerase-3 subunit delta
MSTLTRTELDRSLKTGQVQPLYALVGCETYQRDIAAQNIADLALSGTLLREFNEVTFSLLSQPAMSAIAAAEQLPMMSDRRVVRIKDFARLPETDEDIVIRYVERPVDSTVMIFTADELDKRKKLTKVLLSECTVVDFSPVKDAEARAWAKARLTELKATADDRTLAQLIDLVGTDLQTLSIELDKLSAAAINTGQITPEMVDQLIPRSRELSNFDLGDQLVAGNRKQALQTLHRLLEDDVAAVMLLGLIAGNYHRLAVAKELLDQGKRDEVYRSIYGPPAKREAVMNTLRRSDAKKIAHGIKLIADADLAIKTSQGGGGPKGARLQLENLVCQLAG